MVKVTLVYPYLRPKHDKSLFRFPPLGLGYIAACLRKSGITVDLIDCTFLSQREALEKIRGSSPGIIGIQAMFSMKDKAIELAKLLKEDCEVLVVGGPLPTTDPKGFLGPFNVAVIGEGEQTMLELVGQIESGKELSRVKGIAYNDSAGKIVTTSPRDFIEDLDGVPFPARELFDNDAYKGYYRSNFGDTVTTVITSRGCPFTCDFCSRPVFGNRFRARSAANIVDEMEVVESLGYDRIWFADDCFTLDHRRLLTLCDEIVRRGLRITWECLSRVDTIDRASALKMRESGCVRVFFGIESGNDSVLRLMNKQATTKRAEEAVRVTKESGIQVGAFFILGYPGETDGTVLDTVRFASALPLDYLSFTLPYPIPGTPLYERTRNERKTEDWSEPRNPSLVKHKLLFHGSFSEAKLKFAIVKAMVQWRMRKYLGRRGYRIVGEPFEGLTDHVFRLMR